MRHYAPYGDPFGVQGSLGTSFGCTGEQTDANGLIYLRARHYAPSLGIFPSLDPFEGDPGRPMSLNGYSWVEGKVIWCSDASGMSPAYDLPPEVQEIIEIIQGVRCEFPGINGASFRIDDDSVTNIMTVGAFIEGRFAGPDGISLSVATYINKLKTVNSAGIGSSVTGILQDKYKSTAKAICPGGVITGCADTYVNSLLSGDSAYEPYPLDREIYPGGTPVLMRNAYFQTKLQLLSVCGKRDLLTLYATYAAALPKLSSSGKSKTRYILAHPDIKDAYTFHMDWYNEMPLLKRCMIASGVSAYDHITTGIIGVPGSGLMVTNTPGVMDRAVCSAQFPKSDTIGGASCDFPVCCRSASSGGFTDTARRLADSPPCIKGQRI